MNILKMLLLLMGVNIIQVHAQESFNTTLLGRLAPAGITLPGIRWGERIGYTDIWGYYDPYTDKEFAILGHDTTFIIDVSDPTNPVVVSTLGPSSDIKTFSHYIALNKGEIWDIADVYNPVLMTSDGIIDHNIHADYPYAYTGGDILNISNPSNPTFVGTFGVWAHDLMAFNDTVYFADNPVKIYNVAQHFSPKLILDIVIPAPGFYAHTPFPTVDGNFLLVSDELGPLGISIWDISDPGNINQAAQYGPLHDIPTAHNVYVKEKYAYISHYVDGLRILDISDPTNPVEAGYYDTYPDSVVALNGAWGVYPFAPSGNIYVSDRSYGLFIIKFDSSKSLSRLSGKITDKSSGNPISGAWIFVRGIYKAVSDSSGNYVLHAPEGNHMVQTRMFNYLPDTTEVMLTNDSTYTLNPSLQYVPPAFSFDRETIDFGAVDVQNSITDSITFFNAGLTSLNLSFESLDRAHFSITSNPSMIHPDSSAALVVRFSPSDVFNYSSDLRLNSDVELDTFNLHGIGIKYSIEPGSYLSPDSDSLLVSVLMPGNAFRLQGLIRSDNDSILDSFFLNSDGKVDSLFSGSWAPPSSIETDYSVDLNISTPDSQLILFHRSGIKKFTTIGPLVLKSYTILSADTLPQPGDITLFSMTIENQGVTNVATNVGIELSSSDTCITEMIDQTGILDSVGVKESINLPGFHMIRLNDRCSGIDDIRIDLSISSKGTVYWKDMFLFPVYPIGISIENNLIPTEYILTRNHPNPFNPVTNISYSLPLSGDVSLIIYNLLGEEVARLVDGFQPAGEYHTEWNASNVASGIYFYRLNSEDFTQTKKMVLMK